jgi:hypothetical protein
MRVSSKAVPNNNDHVPEQRFLTFGQSYFIAFARSHSLIGRLSADMLYGKLTIFSFPTGIHYT